jgi:hypothetical protein
MACLTAFDGGLTVELQQLIKEQGFTGSAVASSGA